VSRSSAVALSVRGCFAPFLSPRGTIGSLPVPRIPRYRSRAGGTMVAGARGRGGPDRRAASGGRAGESEPWGLARRAMGAETARPMPLAEVLHLSAVDQARLLRRRELRSSELV